MKEELYGRWRIAGWYQEYDDGRVVHPFGEKPAGFITYQRPNFMSCTISRADRQNFQTGGQWDADAAEKAAAYDGFMSYCGTFDVEGDEIRHKVELSIFPNWIGSAQKRKVVMDGDTMELRARLEAGTAEARTAILKWTRESDTAAGGDE